MEDSINRKCATFSHFLFYLCVLLFKHFDSFLFLSYFLWNLKLFTRMDGCISGEGGRKIKSNVIPLWQIWKLSPFSHFHPLYHFYTFIISFIFLHFISKFYFHFFFFPCFYPFLLLCWTCRWMIDGPYRVGEEKDREKREWPEVNVYCLVERS